MPLVIVYNGYTIPNQIEKVGFNLSYPKGSISVDFILTAADGDTLTTDDGTMVAALTGIDADLLITFGVTPTTWKDWQNSTNVTGFLGKPTLVKIGAPSDGEVGRRYRWTCDFEMAAVRSGDGYRRSGDIQLEYETSVRRRVTIKGQYTSGGTSSAYANASTNGPTWADAIVSGIGGTYDTLSTDYGYEHRTHLCSFRRIYREQVEDDKNGGAQSGVIDSIVHYRMQWPQRFGVSPFEAGAEESVVTDDSGGPPPTITASYRCTLDTATISSDTYTEDLYRGTLKPWLLSHLSDVLNLAQHAEAPGTPLITLDESWEWSRSTCEMNGTITLMAPRNNSAITEYFESIRQDADTGVTDDPLWDGVADTYATWGIGRQLMAFHTVRITKLGGIPAQPPGLASPWRLRRYSESQPTTELIGAPGASLSSGNAQTATAYTKQWTRDYRYIVGGVASGISLTEEGGGEAAIEVEPDAGGFLVLVDEGGDIHFVEGE